MSIPKRLAFSTFLFAALLTGQTVWAETYYVDHLMPGSDSNEGRTQAAPFLTIPKCVAVAINPADTCLVKNGTYTYAESVLLRYSGTAGNPITLKNFPGHSPVLKFTGIGHNGIVIQIAGGGPNAIRYVVLEGFEIMGATNTGVKFTNAENLIIRKNDIHDNGTIDGNGILGSGYQVTIENNRIYRNGSWTNIKGHGLYLIGKGYVIKNNLIYNNLKYGIQAAGYVFDPSRAPNTDFAGFSGLIANNTIAYSAIKAGIVLWDAGTGGGGNNPAEMQGIIIKNNILYENCAASDCNGGVSGINFSATSIGAQVRNNVFYASGTGGTVFIVGGAPGSTYNADILTVNDLTTNPNMKDAPATLPASPDFHLTSQSTVAIDRGLNLAADGVVTDFDGVKRGLGAGFDIGAYEFRTSQDTAPPNQPTNLTIR